MIKELNVSSYGKLKDKNIKLTQGINVLYGENEAGKSTLTSFIRAMLFGIGTTRTKNMGENDRRRFKPWQNEGFYGSMVYQTVENDEYAITRAFKATGAKDILQVIDSRTGAEVSKYAKEFGQVLFGVCGETFEATAFIRQGGNRVNKNDELIGKITNLVSTATEDVGYESSLKKMKSLKEELRKERGKNGSLDLLEQKQQQLQKKRRALQEDYESCILYIEQLNHVDKQLKQEELSLQNNKAAKSFLEYEKAAADYGKILTLRRETTTMEAEVRALKETIAYGGNVPNQEAVARLLKALAELALAKHGVEEIEAEIKTLKRKEEGFTQNQLNGYHNLEKDLQEVKEKKERKGWIDATLASKIPLKEQRDALKKKLENLFSQELKMFHQNDVREKAEAIFEHKTQSKVPVGTIIIGVLLAVLGMVGFAMNPILGVVILGVLVVFLLQSKGSSGKREKGTTVFLKSIGVKDVETLERLYYEYKKKKQEQEVLQQTLINLEETLENEEEERLLQEQKTLDAALLTIFQTYHCSNEQGLEALRTQAKELSFSIKNTKETLAEKREKEEKANDNLKEKSRLFFEGADEIVERKESLNDYETVLKEREKQTATVRQTQMELEQKQGFLKELAAGMDEEKLKADYFVYKNAVQKGEVPTGSGAADNTSAVVELTREKSELKTKIEAHFAGEEEIGAVVWELERVEEEIAEKKVRYHAVSLAYETLEEAMEIMSKEFSPHLTKMVAKNLKLLTDGTYSGLLIDKDYNIKVCDEGGGSYELEYFSAGTIDQIYLAFRLALVDVVSEKEKMPIIFDDSFCHFDDSRLQSTLKMLNGLSKDYQIIVLTCQKREELFLKNSSAFHYITL